MEKQIFVLESDPSGERGPLLLGGDCSVLRCDNYCQRRLRTRQVTLVPVRDGDGGARAVGPVCEAPQIVIGQAVRLTAI